MAVLVGVHVAPRQPLNGEGLIGADPGVVQAQRFQDVRANTPRQWRVGLGRDDHAGQDVAGVAVCHLAAGLLLLADLEGERDNLLGRPYAVGDDRNVVLKLGQPTAVIDQRANGDHVGLGQLGEPAADRLVEIDAALGDELVQRRGDEGLGIAADPKEVIGGHGRAGSSVGNTARLQNLVFARHAHRQ